MEWDVETIMEDGQQEAFVIDDDSKAEWALQRIAEADAELVRMIDWYKDQQKLAAAHHDRRVERLKAMLEQYFSTVPAKETKTQRKYALPSGDLVQIKAKQDYAVEDPERLLKWCIESDKELVRVKAEPAWSALKKRLTMTDAGIVDTGTGLVVDGVVRLSKPPEFKVYFTMAKGAD